LYAQVIGHYQCHGQKRRSLESVTSLI